MQHVEFAERNVPVAHLIHRALILAAPGIRKGEPVGRDAERLEDLLGLACDAGAPIDQRPEDIEQQRFGGVVIDLPTFDGGNYAVNGLPFLGHDDLGDVTLHLGHELSAVLR